MKKLLILTILLLTSGQLFCQDFCQTFKNGDFVLVDERLPGQYTISRKDSLQIETSPKGLVVQFKVKWINSCTYVITVDKILKNPYNQSFPLDAVFTVKIVGKTEDGYIQETTANFSARTMKSEIKRIKL
jgi:hypothetical protein